MFPEHQMLTACICQLHFCARETVSSIRSGLYHQVKMLFSAAILAVASASYALAQNATDVGQLVSHSITAPGINATFIGRYPPG